MTEENWFDPAKEDAAHAIGDQAKIILAKMLPGSTARQYDFPNPPYGRWWVDLCFADRGPIAPNLTLAHRPPWFRSVGVYLYYDSMLQDPHNPSVAFVGPKIDVGIPLDGGPQAVAAAVYESVAKVDLAKMVAAGTVERILAEYPRHPVPWPNFHLAQCAVYLGKYDEARELLQNALKYADQKGRESYGSLAPKAEACLSKLNVDADALRRDLTAMVEHNWSHYKVVSKQLLYK